MDYRPGGGVAGLFTGDATFEPLACADGGLRLAYLEDGMAALGDGPQVAASKRLLWDLTEDAARVFFDEAQARDPQSILDGSRFFHTIDLQAEAEADPPPFEHWCSPDMYSGKLTFESEASFVLSWHVKGPKKLGNIVGRYTRCST